MSAPAIEIRRLSKVYPLAAAEPPPDTLANALARRILGPFRGASAARASAPSAAAMAASANQEFYALRDLSLDVEEGEVLGLVGANGAGKSTLLKILSRICAPTSGSARIRGRVSSLLEVGTGFHPDLTGRENIYLNGILLGMREREVARKLDEIVAFAGFERFLDVPVKRYSSGMQLRLAFSVAAHLEPEVLVVDEVLAVGDAEFQRKCIGRMQEVARGGRTVLFVSHNLSAIRNLCTRAAWLDHGALVLHDDTEKVLRAYLGRSAEGAGTRSEYCAEPEAKRGRAIWIQRLRVIDAQGEAIASIPSRGDLRFEVEVEAEHATPCTLAIAVRDESNHLLANAISDDFDFSIRLVPGTNRYRVAMRRVPFREGTYQVNLSVALQPGAPAIDHVVRALEFRVDGGAGAQTRSAALLLTDAEWERV